MGGSLFSLQRIPPVAASVLPLSAPAPEKPRIAVTMDDPSTTLGPNIAWREANRNILDTLEKWSLKTALFVCGMRVDSAQGKDLLGQWDDAGHLICNHSYSHFNLNSAKTTYDDFVADFERNEPLIKSYRRFTRLFRYPFLKEGDTTEKRDQFRALLKHRGYAVGHVTIDASDWYVDERMNARLEKQPAVSTEPYGDYLVAHLLDRAAFYRQLALDVLGHEIPHTLLLHHKMINALYLEDVSAHSQTRAGSGSMPGALSTIPFSSASRRRFPPAKASSGPWPRRRAASMTACAIPARTTPTKSPKWTRSACDGS